MPVRPTGSSPVVPGNATLRFRPLTGQICLVTATRTVTQRQLRAAVFAILSLRIQNLLLALHRLNHGSAVPIFSLHEVSSDSNLGLRSSSSCSKKIIPVEDTKV